MTDTDTTPGIDDARRPALDALDDCARVSTTCASWMTEIGGMADEVRRALDCADVCAAAERVLIRAGRGPADDASVRAVLAAAAAACEASARACGAHADHHEHCALHSRSAARCAEALHALGA